MLPTVTLAEFERSAQSPKDWPLASAPEIAFCGRSNVGKSSLINLLCARTGLARTSRTPGRTRLTNFFRVELLEPGKRTTLRLVDLPGFGYAKVSKTERSTWRPAVERYLSDRSTLTAVVLLLDPRRGVPEEELELGHWLMARGLRLIPVLTKSDQVAKHERKLVVQTVAHAFGVTPVVASALKREGRDELWRALSQGLT